MSIRKITNPTRYTGLTTDQKPDRADEQGVEEGSTFLELDTGRSYVFEKNQWHEREAKDDPVQTTNSLLAAIHQTLEQIKEELC